MDYAEYRAKLDAVPIQDAKQRERLLKYYLDIFKGTAGTDVAVIGRGVEDYIEFYGVNDASWFAVLLPKNTRCVVLHNQGTRFGVSARRNVYNQSDKDIECHFPTVEAALAYARMAYGGSSD